MVPLELGSSRTNGRVPFPLSTVLIDRRLYVYGLDVCARLHYTSISAFAAKVPLECARSVRLADRQAPTAMHIPHGHPLDAIRTGQDPSLWIDLPGLFLLFHWSPHPLARRFGTWMSLQRSAFLSAVPPCLLRQGLWLVQQALGPRAQILAEISGLDARGWFGEHGRVLDPPQTGDLSRLLVSCLKAETVNEPA